MNDDLQYTVFEGNRHVLTDNLRNMLLKTKEYLDERGNVQLLIFEDNTGKQIDFDFRGTPTDVLERIPEHPLFRNRQEIEPKVPPGPGRPRLGVVCREVSLLPRHWEWLERQPNGSSAAIRRLVDDARKREVTGPNSGSLRDAAAKFMLAMAGNQPNFEEVNRALYAGNYDRSVELMAAWPADIREHSIKLVNNCRQMICGGISCSDRQPEQSCPA